MTEEFNPNITQRVVAATKKEVSIYAKALAFAHKSLPTYYFYLVGASILAPEMSDSIPIKWRKIILGVATVIVFLDKVRRSKPSVSTE